MKHSFSCILIFCFTNIFGQNELKIGDKSKQIEFSKSFPKNYEIPKDKPLFLDFWATWCGPCVAGLIEHKELVKKYSKIIEFIAITDSTSKNVQKFIINNKFENKFIIDKDSSTFGNYGVNGIPYAFLIDTNKIIIWSGYSRDFKESVI